MQQKWDNIDEIILSSKIDDKISENYNEILMQKLENSQKNVTNTKNSRTSITALSFILTGLLFLCIYTFNFQCKLMDMQLRMQSNITYIQSEYNMDFKHFLGE